MGRRVGTGWATADREEEVESPRSRRSNFGGGVMLSASLNRSGKVFDCLSEGREGSFLSPPLACRGRE